MTPNERNNAWAAGRTAGKQLRGRGTNPYGISRVSNELANVWDEGYSSGLQWRVESGLSA